MKRIIAVCMLVCAFCFSLHAAEESSSSIEVVEASLNYIEKKYNSLKAILQNEPNGQEVLRALKQKCDNKKYKLSKEYKKILKRYGVIIKEPYGCFNVKKRFVVCHLINSHMISKFLNENSIQSAESSSMLTKSGEMLPGKASAEDLEQVV